MAARKVVVFGAPLSQPTRAVLWTCAWLGIKVDFRNVDAVKGEHRAEEFLKLNPNAKFPVLVDSDFVLWESHAELRYLVSKFGETPEQAALYPSDLATRARVDAWLDWKHSNIRVGAAGLVRRRVMARIMKDYSQHSMAFDIVEIPEAREVRILMESLAIMESQLCLTDFIAGTSGPTLADVALATEVEQLSLLENAPPPQGGALADAFPAVHKWHQAMRSAPGFKEAHAGFGKIAAGISKMRAASKL